MVALASPPAEGVAAPLAGPGRPLGRSSPRFARGVALERLPQLVHFIGREDRVLRPRLAHPLEDPPGHRSDVGPPVPADVRLVARAPEGDPDVLASEGAGDRLRDRGLSDPGRAREEEDAAAVRPLLPGRHRGGRPGAARCAGRLAVRGRRGGGFLSPAEELADGEELEDPVLHVLQGVVVLVEDPLRLDDVEVLLAPRRPRQLRHELEVAPHDLGFHRLAREALELLPLPVDLLADLLGQDERVELLLEAVQVVAVVLALSQLLLDRLQLLAEEHLALAVAELLLDLRLDLLLRVEDVDLPLDVHERPPDPVLDGQRLEQELPLGGRDVDVAGHEVGETARVVGIGQDVPDRLVGQAELLRELGGALAQLLQERDERGIGGVERTHLLRLHDDRLEPPFLLLDPHPDPARLPLEEGRRAADAARDRPDRSDRTDRVEELGRHRLEVLPLGDGEDELIGALHRGLDRVERPWPPGGNREADAREKDRIAERDDRENLRWMHLDLSSQPKVLDSRMNFSKHGLDFQVTRRMPIYPSD